MKAHFIFFFLFIINASFGQVTNVKAGMWSDITVWSNNKIPTSNDSIYLSYNITINVNANCKALNTNGHNVIVNSGVTFNILRTSNVISDIDGNVYNIVTIGTQV